MLAHCKAIELQFNVIILHARSEVWTPFTRLTVVFAAIFAICIAIIVEAVAIRRCRGGRLGAIIGKSARAFLVQVLPVACRARFGLQPRPQTPPALT